ncbi:putative polycystic kidney disease protein 1-like 2-like [Penaeus vannamei]|uniref:Putative polycystic kidney disease protein 1-like 2-like n=1 Tax=Penaeus vannamei TaxID=6689 RepID=A0A423TRY2_PENVA|nr:putative polycystic kidney disease protein 1-like 2-like [Penaeus vannamei]
MPCQRLRPPRDVEGNHHSPAGSHCKWTRQTSFHYNLSIREGVLSTTLRLCWEDLRGFIMVFFLCFFTFVQMFFIILNNSVFGFHNLVLAVETCFSMILGKFQFDEMKEIGVFVTVMFFVFVICSSWVLINLLLTVVIQTFVEGETRPRETRNDTS